MRNLVYKAFQTHPSQAMICESSFTLHCHSYQPDNVKALYQPKNPQFFVAYVSLSRIKLTDRPNSFW